MASGMEQVHGVDVSWMTQGSPKDRLNNKTSTSPPTKTPAPAQPRQIPGSDAKPNQPAPAEKKENGQASNNQTEQPPAPNATPAPTRRNSRSNSLDKPGPNGTPPQRRNSWFSNISAKFSSSPPTNVASTQQTNGLTTHHHHHLLHHHQEEPSQQPQSPQQASSPPPVASLDPPPPRPSPSRNAVLQHATKPEGNGPYTPAPPKSSQAGFLGVFRRLSSSSGSNLGPGGRLGHGLVERKVLNVDKSRERCPIAELKDAKLRKVSFCVDVEIAPMPKYAETDLEPKPIDKSQRKKIAEKGEGDALKNAAAEKREKKEEQGGKPVATKDESTPKPTEAKTATKSTSSPDSSNNKDDKDAIRDESTPLPEKEPGTTKKKEKKKKSEEERKARKEKKRKLAEANGSVPLELHYDTSDSSSGSSRPTRPKTASLPTTNPVRIYRRCCQLRETPILKKITEQLLDSANASTETGIVAKLDLTGYWMQLPDLITLGDYLAVVPVRTIILENSGLSDEGLRVILAGLLAARRPGLRRTLKPKNILDDQGGVVERLVLKNNKLGPDGWKHLCLFLYLCRSLKSLDISHIPLPRQAVAKKGDAAPNGLNVPRTISELLSAALAERLGGDTLDLINMGETEPSMEQLGIIMDGIIQCGVRRLGLAHNYLDDDGVDHVVRYLSSGKCEGLDLGGNNLKDQMEKIAGAISDDAHVWALSLAGCELTPASLGKIFPVLVKLPDFRFIDLSHNHDLFQSSPNAVGSLRKFLPKMTMLKRIHLQDVGLTAEQAIALVEVLPEVHHLAHVNILENAELVKLTHPKTEEAQEEACALFASLIAAARVSNSLIAVDIEVPGDEASEIVKAMAKQVVAYCLRNMERLHDIGATVASALSEAQPETIVDQKEVSYIEVLAHLVGHDGLDRHESPEENDVAPDDDYMIGGTGVVKALTCCLQNRGDESRRGSTEVIRDANGGETTPRRSLATGGGKARDMSKHLLASARKIRRRLQPALNKARALSGDDSNLRKLVFLDETLQGIIRRFEDEYPDTREPDDEAGAPTESRERKPSETSSGSPPATEEYPPAVSDGEDDVEIHPSRPLSRSNSVLSRTQAEEEGRVMRAGHRFRRDYLTDQHIAILTSIDDIGADPQHIRMLEDMVEEIGGEFKERVKSKGLIRAFKEDKELMFEQLRASDPEYWERFQEAQRKTRANMKVSDSGGKDAGSEQRKEMDSNDSAIAD